MAGLVEFIGRAGGEPGTEPASLFVLERVSGSTWTVAKSNPAVQQSGTNRDMEALVEGWYVLRSRDLVFMTVGQVERLPRQGSLAWASGPWP